MTVEQPQSDIDAIPRGDGVERRERRCQRDPWPRLNVQDGRLANRLGDSLRDRERTFGGGEGALQNTNKAVSGCRTKFTGEVG